MDDAPLQLVVIRDGNGEARLQGGGRIESPYPVNWQLQLFPHQVMERGADRALGRCVAAQNPIKLRLDRLQREWVGAFEDWFELAERRNDARDRFTVVAIGSRLTESLCTVAVDKAHNYVAMMRVSAPRDHERVDRVELDCLVRKLHHSKSGSSFEKHAKLHPAATACVGAERAVRAIRNSWCAAAVERKLISASARSLPRS